MQQIFQFNYGLLQDIWEYLHVCYQCYRLTNQTIKLGGAEFVVQKNLEEDKFLKQTVKNGVITETSWVDTKEEATKFISNDDGTFEGYF